MMFATKGYTIQYFINLFTNATEHQLNTNGVYNVVSPRDGILSVRAAALDVWLNGDTTSIVNGEYGYKSFGKTSRTRVLKALRNRKTTGSVFGSNY